MHWLQGTFANRFNRFRGESGHVFQGRYKAILVEPDRPLLGLVNYIHLNPGKWENVMLKELRSKGKNEVDVASDPKGADWKIEIARRLRKETSASNPWIADRFNMGHPSRVSLNPGSR